MRSVEVGDGDLGPLLRQHLGDPEADAARTTGDEGHPVLKGRDHAVAPGDSV
jgi:hypothetical protein